jgi:FtsH-binding integral membrane protein
MMEGLRIPPESPEKEVPRSIQVLAGLVLAAFTLFCGLASVTMLVVPNKRSPVLAIIVAFLLLLGCGWVFEKCLMSPNALRVVSFFFLVLPVVGLFTGYYREMGLVAIFQAVMYFFGFLGLRALARKREASGASSEQTKT